MRKCIVLFLMIATTLSCYSQSRSRFHQNVPYSFLMLKFSSSEIDCRGCDIVIDDKALVVVYRSTGDIRSVKRSISVTSRKDTMFLDLWVPLDGYPNPNFGASLYLDFLDFSGGSYMLGFGGLKLNAASETVSFCQELIDKERIILQGEDFTQKEVEDILCREYYRIKLGNGEAKLLMKE